MSDAHDSDHGHGEGLLGHEVDDPPNARLFNILLFCTILVFLSCVALVQVFNSQAREIVTSRANQGSYKLAAYKTEMGSHKAAIASGKDKVLKDKSALGSFPAPTGWVHPDDMAGAKKPEPAAPAEPVPADGEAPAEGEAPAGEGAAEGADADKEAAPEGADKDAAAKGDAEKAAKAPAEAKKDAPAKDAKPAPKADDGKAKDAKPEPKPAPEKKAG